MLAGCARSGVLANALDLRGGGCRWFVGCGGYCADEEIMETIGEHLAPVEQVTIGKCVVRRIKSGSLWMENEEGEGMELVATEEAALAEILEDFFDDRF